MAKRQKDSGVDADAIEMEPVISSNLDAIGFDEENEVLQVQFKSSGDIWQYDGVPKEEHAALTSAPSIGSYFSREIRNRYNGRKI